MIFVVGLGFNVLLLCFRYLGPVEFASGEFMLYLRQYTKLSGQDRFTTTRAHQFVTCHVTHQVHANS